MSQPPDVAPPAPTPLPDAANRLVRTVDGLDEEQLAGPSLLPGWTRGHVVAHLALNAEALTAAVAGVLAGEAVPMYPSAEDRDADIEELAAAPRSELRARLLAGTTELAEALAALPVERHDVTFERTPGSDRTVAAGDVAVMRLTEVEVHHVDLDAGYQRSDWAADFAEGLVDRLAGRAAATLQPVDSGRTWLGPEGSPVVQGPLADLAWWLAGRGGDGLVVRDGDLPPVAAW